MTSTGRKTQYVHCWREGGEGEVFGGRGGVSEGDAGQTVLCHTGHEQRQVQG